MKNIKKEKLKNIEEANKRLLEQSNSNIITEISGSDVKRDFGQRIEELIDDVYSHYNGELNKTMVSNMIIHTIQGISDKKGYSYIPSPSKYE